jgi:hypothetical protein
MIRRTEAVMSEAARWSRFSAVRLLALALCLAFAGVAPAQTEPTFAVAALQKRFSSLQQELAQSAFGRPLRLDSVETGNALSGDVYAIVDYPFSRVKAALDRAEDWCDVLILHLNVKQCRAAGSPPINDLSVYIGTKYAQRLATVPRIEFSFHVLADAAQYLQVELRAGAGPLGTRNYRVMLEAIPVDSGRSFLHMTYSYDYGRLALLAMKGYLATVGGGKIGFTVVGRTADGRAQYVTDVRGVVERNAMRYYLAIDAYVRTFDLPPQQGLERRLHEWFTATERYAPQLHELSEREYLEMKREEISRQQVARAGARPG